MICIFSLSFITSFLALCSTLSSREALLPLLAAALNSHISLSPAQRPSFLHETFLATQSSSFRGLHLQWAGCSLLQEQPGEWMSRNWDPAHSLLTKPWASAAKSMTGPEEGEGLILICTKVSEGLAGLYTSLPFMNHLLIYYHYIFCQLP